MMPASRNELTIYATAVHAFVALSVVSGVSTTGGFTMQEDTQPFNTAVVIDRPLSAHRDIARYYPWDAMRRAVPNQAAVSIYAEVFGVSESLIEKMRHPHGGRIDQGRRSLPAKLYEAIWRAHTEAGVPLADAVAVIGHPARKLGFRLSASGHADVPADLGVVLPSLTRSTGELAGYLAECLADDELDALERRGLRERIHASLAALIGVENLAEVGTA